MVCFGLESRGPENFNLCFKLSGVTMEWLDRHVRQSFWWILLWMAALCAGFYFTVIWKTMQLVDRINDQLVATRGLNLEFLESLVGLMQDYRLYLSIAIPVIVLLFAVLLWATLRRSLHKSARQVKIPGRAVQDAKAGARTAEDKERLAALEREKALEDQKRALLLFSMFQREGRLMDFFSEDLAQYDDAQIGAAVRGVQEACRKIVEKHLKPQAVLNAAEGDTVTVPPGFDPAAIKLSGHVAGDPPFKGVLRHHGWKAGRFELPTVGAAGDPAIIAPAEVEIP